MNPQLDVRGGGRISHTREAPNPLFPTGPLPPNAASIIIGGVNPKIFLAETKAEPGFFFRPVNAPGQGGGVSAPSLESPWLRSKQTGHGGRAVALDRSGKVWYGMVLSVGIEL